LLARVIATLVHPLDENGFDELKGFDNRMQTRNKAMIR
jgi:hypothetical protein